MVVNVVTDQGRFGGDGGKRNNRGKKKYNFGTILSHDRTIRYNRIRGLRAHRCVTKEILLLSVIYV